jgi:hypothetical protein
MGMQAPDPFGFNNMNFFGNAAQPITPAAGAAPVEGQPLEQPLEPDQVASRPPVGALILIGLGVIFLLDQFGWFHFDWFGRFWPLILIAIGVSVLMKRTARVR